MDLRLLSNNNLPSPPQHISQLVTFIIGNLHNGDIFEYFCLILKQSTSKGIFIDYKTKLVQPTSEESQLLNLLEVFYTAASADIDNARGKLLEYITDELLSSKYISHHRYNEAVLELFDMDGKSVASISPHDIDFFLKESHSGDIKCFECKLSVAQSHPQIACFNRFAKELGAHRVNCRINILHIVFGTFAKLYPRWYPSLCFVGPSEIIGNVY